MQSVRVGLLGLLVGLLALGGCGSPRETVSVTERPDTTTEETVAASVDIEEVVEVPSRYDTVQARPFDQGKMWPIHDLPSQHFQETYGVTPDEEWRTQVQRASLRFGENCSGSFVSERGLVMTNHHCARDHIQSVSEAGESLFQDGFYAVVGAAERRSPELFVDQLVRVEEVTDRITDPSDRQEQQMSREFRVTRLETQMTNEAQQNDERLRVEITRFYRGAAYVAYTYRRYEDVRLVMVPEQDLGFFGGEADNFTYPRHTLDVAFFRVYEQGQPLDSDHHFDWASEGAEEGDAVFAAGNPGSTSRHKLASQFEYERDHQLPSRLEVLRDRRDVFREYISEHPEEAVRFGVQNTFFAIQNSIKSLRGELRGLQDPYLLARRTAAVKELQSSVQAVDSLRGITRGVQEIQQLQQSKRTLADRNEAFVTFANPQLGSRILSRALFGYYINFLRRRGVPGVRLQDLRDDAERIEDWPTSLEEAVLAAQLRDIQNVYGANHPALERLFVGQSPEELAEQLVQESVLTEADAFLSLLEEERYTQSDDPSVPVINALAPLYLNVTRQMNDFRSSEEGINRRLIQLERRLLDRPVSPDATFSLRVSDGRVSGYHHHGTRLPAFTSYYGLYDKYHAHGREDWSLPDQWVSPPSGLDLDTPLNLVSTNDISGGSSGSPLLNRDLEVVGVVFDSNIEALPNKYLYQTNGPRAISVDARGILEALEHVYEAERVVEELVPDA